jgi:hypothetical protein
MRVCPIVGMLAVFVAITSTQAADVVAAPPGPARKACIFSDFRPIRGYCAEDYLGFDIIFEDAIAPAEHDAFVQYFSINTEGSDIPEVQIRHSEDSARRRKRGEFMITIERRRGDVFAAKFWRAREPLRIQLYALVHERLYPKIAEAFAKSKLGADSPEWEAKVRGMVPATADLVREIQVEHFATTSATCPALDAQLLKLRNLTVRASLPGVGVDSTGLLTIYLHPEIYDVVLYNYPRLVYVSGPDDDDPFFAWAEETVGALQTCWITAS